MAKNSVLRVCRRDILDIYNYALDKIRPNLLVESSVSIKDDTLSIRNLIKDEDIQIDLRGCSIHVIGGGKSVLRMAQGFAKKAMSSNSQLRFSHGCLSVPIGLKKSYQNCPNIKECMNFIGAQCLYGSKDNLPDEQSVLASQTILNNIEMACESDRREGLKPLFIVLISGGGSACLTKPHLIDLKEKLDLIKWLAQNGADIVELNKVRSYFSAVKGGKLARLISKSHPESRILTLILSDVIGDPIDYIASGPTSLSNLEDNSQQKQSMLDVLSKYHYQDIASLKLTESSTSEQQEIVKNRAPPVNVIIGNNQIALNAAVERASLLGYKTKCIEEGIRGDSKRAAVKLCAVGDELLKDSSSPVLAIGGGEVTIHRLKGEDWGKGGRAQELALDYLITKSRAVERDSAVDMFLAGTTDGQDGPTEVAACLASHHEWLQSEIKTVSLADLEEAKRKHDSFHFWRKIKPDWQITSGLTGTNVMDLYLYMKRNS